jgi:hypothetical protein
MTTNNRLSTGTHRDAQYVDNFNCPQAEYRELHLDVLTCKYACMTWRKTYCVKCPAELNMPEAQHVHAPVRVVHQALLNMISREQVSTGESCNQSFQVKTYDSMNLPCYVNFNNMS